MSFQAINLFNRREGTINTLPNFSPFRVHWAEHELTENSIQEIKKFQSTSEQTYQSTLPPYNTRILPIAYLVHKMSA